MFNCSSADYSNGCRATRGGQRSRAAAPDGRSGEEGEFADLGVAVVELVRHVGELEDAAVAKRASGRSEGCLAAS